MRKKSAPAGAIVLAIALAIAYFSGGGTVEDAHRGAPGDAPRAASRTDHAATGEGGRQRGDADGPKLVGDHRVAGVRIVDHRSGAVLPVDEVDLGPTLDRIARGDRHPHRNDGAVYRNLNRKLPRHPEGYYREYVVPTPGIDGPGPQRLVVGKNGEVYYTWDHYDNFIAVDGGR